MKEPELPVPFTGAPRPTGRMDLLWILSNIGKFSIEKACITNCKE